MPKRGLGIDVLTAAQARIAWAFETFDRLYLSFSGGKDSTVMLHLVMAEAQRRARKVGLLFIDLEAQYQLTIQHVENCYRTYAAWIEPYWIALPLALRNAVSTYQPKWCCWDPAAQPLWVRSPSPLAITRPLPAWTFFTPGMEFEDFVAGFGAWYAQGHLTGGFVGIRADESLNRYRTIASPKSRYADKAWTTWKGGNTYNIYPIYDWRTADLWTYTARYQQSYNALYDRMHQAGLTIHQMRICQPYGDDQRKGLWLYHVIEPETWGKIVARVNGANSGALYAKEPGNILGNRVIHKPAGHTWESYAKLLLASLPPQSREHFSNKITVFLKWWGDRGYSLGIPDVAPAADEAAKKVPSWRRICKMLLKNDYWAKSLSFSQTKAPAYAQYLKVMKNRRQRWGIRI
jgi:predicted phosphoadenosine phosphosulfate sulfurtransferase